MSEETKKDSKEEAGGEKKEVKVPEKFKELVSQVEKLTVLELSELVKVLEEKFGVSASQPIMMAASAASDDASADGGKKESEKSSFNVELTAAGDQKINIIKAVREITGLGLKESKDIVDASPKIIKEGVAKADAEAMKSKLEAVGATVTLK